MPEKIPVEVLREAILKQYGTQTNLAKKMGMSDSQFSTGLKVQSSHFIVALKKAGLKLDRIYEQLSKPENQLITRAAELEQMVASLQGIIKEKDKLIEHQSKLLEKYEKLMSKM